MSAQDVRLVIEKYCRLAGMERRITPHCFRHAFASLLLEQGCELKYIQEFLGHSSISTTQIYLHTSAEAKKRALHDLHPRSQLDIAVQ